MAIHVQVTEGIGELILDRPERAHAYDRAHLDALEAGIAELEAKVLVMLVRATGSGAFCGGADIDEMRSVNPMDALELQSQRVFSHIARSPLISIAAVHGPAVAGGFELALACDLRVVGPAARFSLPETEFGLIPSAGGCTRLTRAVGPSVAKQVILAGRTLSAQESITLGLSIQMADDPAVAALGLAHSLETRDPAAMRLAKQVIDQGETSAALAAERFAEALLYAHKRGR